MTRWIVTAGKRDGGGQLGEWQFLELTFRKAHRIDAVKEMGRHIGTSMESYYRDRVIIVKEATGGTQFWDDEFGEIRITWQSNLPHRDPMNGNEVKASGWYAPSFESKPTKEAVSLLRKIVELGRDPGPEIVVPAVRAIPVRYLDFHIWIEAELDLISPADMAAAVQG